MSDLSSDGAVSISYDANADAYLAKFDDDAIAPSMAIIEAMASVCDATPTELDPLVETVDPIAIDRLVKGADEAEERVLEFHYLDHTVTVYGLGLVEIRPPSDDD